MIARRGAYQSGKTFPILPRIFSEMFGNLSEMSTLAASKTKPAEVLILSSLSIDVVSLVQRLRSLDDPAIKTKERIRNSVSICMPE